MKKKAKQEPKIKRLLKALSNEYIKRLPYILLILVVLSFIQFTRLWNQTARSVQIATRNSLDNQTLLKKVADLAEDNKQLSIQNKQLAEQNNQLSSQNAQHLDCLAQLFARYTRDGRPVLAIDLNTCMINEGNATSSATNSSSGSRPSSTSPGASASSPSSNPTPNSNNSQSDNSQTPPQPSASVFKKVQNTVDNVIKKIL